MLLFGAYAVPNFWLATMAVLHLGSVFPVHGLIEPELEMRVRAGELAWHAPEVLASLAGHAVLPVVILAYGGLVVLARYARSGMLEVMRAEYIRTARAQGLSEWRILTRHAMRNGLLPLVTLFGGLLPAMVGGSIIVESIFNIPGMGLLTWEAAVGGDVPVAMGVITVVAVLTMFGYLLADLLHGWLDPRFARDA
jgi:peptide/nickel transport system permease protein